MEITIKRRNTRLIVAIALISFGLIFVGTGALMTSVYGQVTFDDKLAKLDASLDHLVNVCEQETYKTSCGNALEDAWWMECSEYYDKLDTCKNGKIENFLKSEGRPT